MSVMSTCTPLHGSTTARITSRGTDVLSAWGTSPATGPIIVQRATWAMGPSGAAEAADCDGAESADGDREPTKAA